MLKILLISLLAASPAFAAPLLQNSDFASSAQITGAGGSVSQLLNSSKMYNSVDSEIMDTSIARWDAKLSSPVNLTSQVTGILPYANGGTNASTAWTVGSVIFAGATGFAQDNANFFWDATNHRLGIGLTSPVSPLEVSASLSAGVGHIVANSTSAQSASGGGFFLAQENNGSAMTSGNRAAVFAANGFDGTSMAPMGGMSIFATQTYTTSAHGSKISLRTVPNGSTTLTAGLDIDQNQQVTMAAYGAGMCQFSSAGLISSTAPGTSGNVLTSNGTAWVSSAPATAGTVTSVAMTVPGFLSVSGSPVTSTGTLAVTLANESANTVFAGPASGSASAPTFRALNVADETIATQAISASAIDWSLGNVFTKTLGANTTFTFSNQLSGQTLVVRLTNTASNYTVTWPTVKWAGGTAPVMTIGATSDVYTFVYDGTNTYGSVVQDMH